MIGRRRSAVVAVDELLQKQKTALLDGDLSTLGKIEAPLERALNLLKADRAESADLARIQAHAGRNAKLLAAAQKGIAMARSQVTARGPNDLSTYDANGQSQLTSTGAKSFQARR